MPKTLRKTIVTNLSKLKTTRFGLINICNYDNEFFWVDWIRPRGKIYIIRPVDNLKTCIDCLCNFLFNNVDDSYKIKIIPKIKQIISHEDICDIYIRDLEKLKLEKLSQDTYNLINHINHLT